MIITYGKLYKNSEKNIKKHYREQETLIMIKNHIKQCNHLKELETNPISHMYGYEALKHQLHGYYSFNLCKNGGKIRLIFSIKELSNEICLEYISKDHYNDFKK